MANTTKLNEEERVAVALLSEVTAAALHTAKFSVTATPARTADTTSIQIANDNSIAWFLAGIGIQMTAMAVAWEYWERPIRRRT